MGRSRNQKGSTVSNVEDYHNWDAAQFAEYLKTTAGLGDYYETLIQHKVTGQVAPHLTDHDLKDMGISTVGDRKTFLNAISVLQKEQRKQEREKVIWEGEEVLFFSCWDRALGTCCGCCPVDASQYKLTGTHLVIKTVNPCRVGPMRCCCNHQYVIDNVDLTHVEDVDVKGIPAPCCLHTFCCGVSQDHVHAKSKSDGEKILKIAKGQGEVVARMISNQIEEAQKIERD